MTQIIRVQHRPETDALPVLCGMKRCLNDRVKGYPVCADCLPKFMNSRKDRYLYSVYFIQDGEGPIKIGITRGSVKSRMASIQCSNPRPLKLLAYVTTKDKNLEPRVHEALKDHRITGEWFSPSREVMMVVGWAKKRALAMRFPPTEKHPEAYELA